MIPNPKPLPESADRPRCHHIIDTPEPHKCPGSIEPKTGRCWLCKRTPEETEQENRQRKEAMETQQGSTGAVELEETLTLSAEIAAGREYVRELVWRELDAGHHNCLTCIHYREHSLTGTLYCRANARIKDPLAAYETRLRTVMQRRCKKWEGDHA